MDITTSPLDFANTLAQGVRACVVVQRNQPLDRAQ